MEQEKTIVRRQPPAILPTQISREQAMYLLKTIWPKAPETEIIRAAILCQQYNLNPLMRQVYLIKFGQEWVTVLGINANRQIAQQDQRYSYVDGPRVMSEKEQVKIFGEVESDKIWAITILKDFADNQYPGYGFWPKEKTVYGDDKGNSARNMAFIRSERNALNKLAPGKLPDVEVADDAYIEGDFQKALEQGKKQVIAQADQDIENLWPEGKPASEPSLQPTGIAIFDAANREAANLFVEPKPSLQPRTAVGRPAIAEPNGNLPKIEAKPPTAKPKRDPSTLKTLEQLAKALKDDFGLSYAEQWKELNISSWNELAITPAEAYQQVQATRLK